MALSCGLVRDLALVSTAEAEIDSPEIKVFLSLEGARGDCRLSDSQIFVYAANYYLSDIGSSGAWS